MEEKTKKAQKNSKNAQKVKKEKETSTTKTGKTQTKANAVAKSKVETTAKKVTKKTDSTPKKPEKTTKKVQSAAKSSEKAPEKAKIAQKKPEKTAKKAEISAEKVTTKKTKTLPKTEQVKKQKASAKATKKAENLPKNSEKAKKTKEAQPKAEQKVVAKKTVKETSKAAEKTEKKVDKKAKKATKSGKKAEKMPKIEKQEKSKGPKQITVMGFHNLPLCTYLMDEVKNPKAVVLIVHGMQEHCLRYVPFAEFLNKNGYIVVLNDLRGHGKTMRSMEEYGRGEKDIFSETVQDELRLIEFAEEKYDLPIYVFGHSYGSMLTQKLVQLSPSIKKAVICGTTNGSCTLFAMASGLVSMLTPFNKKDKRGGLAEKLCIKSYSKKFERGNWLSRDEANFDKYLADELCGGSFPFSFYRSMVKNMRKVNDGIQKIGDKKLFLIAGSCDPVGENGKQVKKLHKIYLKNNVDSKLKIYPNARHELVNETNKDEVYADVLNFFEN